MSFNAIHLPNLPQVPPELIDYSTDMGEFYYGSKPGRVMKKDGKEFIEGLNRRQKINDAVVPWLRENIISDWDDIGYHRFMPPSCGPHLDRTRFFALMYLIEEGGPEVASVFYKPKYAQLSISHHDSRVDDYDQLEVNEVFYFKKNNWYLLNGRGQLHSVENIETQRIALQIGLWKDPIAELRKLP